MSLDVLLTVAGLALLDTMSPATIGVTVYLLLTVRDRLAALLFTYLSTVALFYFSIGAALLLGLEALLTRFGDALDSRPAFWVQAAIGAVLFVGSWFVPTRRPAPELRMPRVHTGRAMVLLGLMTGLAEAAIALPYLGAIGILASADLAAYQWVPVIAGYNLVMVLPPMLLYLGWRVIGERLRARFDQWRDKLAIASREAMAWVMGIAGFLVLRDAVFRLGGLHVILELL